MQQPEALAHPEIVNMIDGVAASLDKTGDERTSAYSTVCDLPLTPALEEFVAIIEGLEAEGCRLKAADIIELIRKDKVPTKLQRILGEHRAKRRNEQTAETLRITSAASFASFQSNSQKGASSWLNCVPNSRNKLSNDEFRVALCTTAEIPLTELPSGIRCECHGSPLIDPFGHHFTTCLSHRQLHNSLIHNPIRDKIKEMGDLSTSQPGRTKAMKPFLILSHGDGSADKTEGDIEFSSGFGPDAHKTILDVGITAVVNAEVRGGTFPPVGSAAAAYEVRKLDKYQAKATAIGAEFIPFIMDSSGLMGVHAQKFFLHLLKIFTSETPVSLADAKYYWRQQLSITLKRGYAKALLQRVAFLHSRSPSHPSWSTSSADMAASNSFDTGSIISDNISHRRQFFSSPSSGGGGGGGSSGGSGGGSFTSTLFNSSTSPGLTNPGVSGI